MTRSALARIFEAQPAPADIQTPSTGVPSSRLAIHLRLSRRQPSLRQKTLRSIGSYHRRWIKESPSLFKPEEGKPIGGIVAKKGTRSHGRTQSEANNGVSRQGHQRWLTLRLPTSL